MAFPGQAPQRTGDSQTQGEGQNAGFLFGPGFEAPGLGTLIEGSVSAVISRQGLKEIVGAIGMGGSVVLLTVVSVFGKIMVGVGGRKLVSEDGLYDRPGAVIFATGMVGCVVNEAGGDFRLIDGR